VASVVVGAGHSRIPQPRRVLLVFHPRVVRSALLRKAGFRWMKEAETAFRALQHTLTTAPVLQLPDFSHNFIVECDTSESGFGTILHQGDGPIAFFSKKITSHHAKLAAYECELIGLVLAVCHWRHYLWGRTFLIRTDHFSLKFLLDLRLSTISQHQWLSKLLGFDSRVEFKPDVSNVVATRSPSMTPRTRAPPWRCRLPRSNYSTTSAPH
jgi:hypothetical protein